MGSTDDQELLRLLVQFMAADTWPESRAILVDHPELLEEQADRMLQALLASANAGADDAQARAVEVHRRLLGRCREVGIPRAFAEQIE
jgi:hypothetical protein